MGDEERQISHSSLYLPGNAFFRLVSGFFAGLVITWLVLLFLGMASWTSDLGLPGVRNLHRARWIAFIAACLSGLCALFAGRLRVSMYWFWFSAAFGVTCVIPWWPSKSGDLLPLGTPYVNGGFGIGKVVLLALHASAAATLAWFIHGWNDRTQRARQSGRSTKTLNQSPT
jgi:hypothetical protein